MATLTTYHWDPVDDCVITETDQAANTIVTYFREPGYFGPLLSETRSSSQYFHHYDAIGSTTFLTNIGGSITDTFSYDASGTIVARTGTTPTPYQWQGRTGASYDVLLSSYYVRARIYSPQVYRWYSRDILFPNQSVDQYVFASNAPITYFDPSGLLAIHSNVNYQTDGKLDGEPCPILQHETSFGTGRTDFHITASNRHLLAALKLFLTWRGRPPQGSPKFVQLVSYTIYLTLGRDDKCLCPNLSCTSCFMEYRFSFLEVLRDHDQQPFTVDLNAPLARFKQACPKCFPTNWCCNWIYFKRVDKTMMLWFFPGGGTNFVEGAAHATCEDGTTKTIQLNKGETGLTGYKVSTNANLTLDKLVINQRLTATSTKFIEIIHKECDGQATFTNHWEDYEPQDG